MKSFTGQCSLPGVWHFVQLPHVLPCVVDFFIVFCTALTALVDKPIEDMLCMIAMCVWHTARISAVVVSIFIANSFLIRSVLHLLASPQIHSMSLSGVLPSLILISSNWYILHC